VPVVPKRREKNSEPAPSSVARVLPMELQIGDRLTDETGDYEVIGRPYTTQMGKNVHVRVKREDGIRGCQCHSVVAAIKPSLSERSTERHLASCSRCVRRAHHRTSLIEAG